MFKRTQNLDPYKRGQKKWQQSRLNFSEEQLGTPFRQQKKWRNFGTVESRTS